MNIKDCFDSLRHGFSQWSDLFANQRFCVQGENVQWYDFADPMLPAILDAETFFRTVESGQYSFQFLDGSAIVRIAYRFDHRGRELKEASLGYIQAPSEAVFCQRDNKDRASTEYLGYCNWLRVDYVPEIAIVPTHAACHLHLSSLPVTRIPLSRVPTPKQFISWVVSIVAPTRLLDLIEQKQHEGLNAPCFVEHWEKHLAPFFFLAVPPSDAQGRLESLSEG
jgi:hypothetical protein